MVMKLGGLLLVAVCLAAAAVVQQAGGAAAGCAATRVRTRASVPVVRAGSFTGYIAPGYDVVGGRFRLHVGAYRDKASGLTQKIPWYVRPHDIPPGAKLGDTLVITARRTSPQPTRSFRETWNGAGSFPLGNVFPTNIAPPGAGCWRLTFRSGTVSGTLVALVRN